MKKVRGVDSAGERKGRVAVLVAWQRLINAEKDGQLQAAQHPAAVASIMPVMRQVTVGP